MLAVARFILGLGMGGEWNTGATLVAETWPAALRAKALSIVQASWAIGYAVASFCAGMFLHFANWRVVFFIGVLPALVTLWIRRGVPESEIWQKHHGEQLQTAGQDAGSKVSQPGFWNIFQPPYRKPTLALLFMNFFGMFGYWGLFTWIPPYLSLPVEQGGRGMGVMGTTTLMVILNLFGMLPGYGSFGWMAEYLGRRKSFLLYAGMAAVMVPLYAVARRPWEILIVGTLAAFFGTGLFSGSGVIASEIFPTSVRARALGFTYNGARTLSSISPFVIGWVGQRKGLSWAFFLCAAGYFFSMLVATQIPETKGRELVGADDATDVA
jgi:MFS family permease